MGSHLRAARKISWRWGVGLGQFSSVAASRSVTAAVAELFCGFVFQQTEPLPKLTSKMASASSLGSADSASSMQHGGEPELMVGLAYSESTGRLSVEVIKGSNFKNLATSKPPGPVLSYIIMNRRMILSYDGSPSSSSVGPTAQHIQITLDILYLGFRPVLFLPGRPFSGPSVPRAVIILTGTPVFSILSVTPCWVRVIQSGMEMCGILRFCTS